MSSQKIVHTAQLWFDFPARYSIACKQRRIFIFGTLGYFKLGALLEGSRRLMSYKLGLQALATFTEKVVPIHKHITLF